MSKIFILYLRLIYVVANFILKITVRSFLLNPFESINVINLMINDLWSLFSISIVYLVKFGQTYKCRNDVYQQFTFNESLTSAHEQDWTLFIIDSYGKFVTWLFSEGQ